MSKRVRDALRAIETYRVDSLDDADTRLPKATVNMVVDLLEAALDEPLEDVRAIRDADMAAAIAAGYVSGVSRGRRRPLGLFAALYQLGGTVLLASEHLTDGQRKRLTVLLLDVLSEPERWTGKMVANAHRRMLAT